MGKIVVCEELQKNSITNGYEKQKTTKTMFDEIFER